ncbi:hypothetical protein BU16DRAFT_557367 [Lophium mytilinum]|uniref:Uncharacterized protein n=1 Tax=Lophium mytilinum TaxID=390894 RepID=A0A6A6R3X6_9PEZI|nr:hypothetical protein BU16DRAFT_557367 [Lophium mytilinum]
MLESQRQALLVARASLRATRPVRICVDHPGMCLVIWTCMCLVLIGLLIAYLVAPAGVSKDLD